MKRKLLSLAAITALTAGLAALPSTASADNKANGVDQATIAPAYTETSITLAPVATGTNAYAREAMASPAAKLSNSLILAAAIGDKTKLGGAVMTENGAVGTGLMVAKKPAAVVKIAYVVDAAGHKPAPAHSATYIAKPASSSHITVASLIDAASVGGSTGKPATSAYQLE